MRSQPYGEQTFSVLVGAISGAQRQKIDAVLRIAPFFSIKITTTDQKDNLQVEEQ